MQTEVSVSQFVTIMNETLAATYPVVTVIGEVSGYKEWNGRLVFFDLKDDSAFVNCMIPIPMLEAPIEDGMRVRVHAEPKLTRKGRFTLNVRRVEPVGEGELQRQFELLKAKLEKEGIFAEERKRPVPRFPRRVAVVTSLESAAYRDFLKTAGERWGGLDIIAVHTQVQGEAAPGHITEALAYVNQLAEPVDVAVLTRGGGGLEDLAAFNSESVVRAVASSRAPIVVGVGHEIDVSLADMAADVRAATPTDIARHIVLDRREMRSALHAYQRVLTRSMHETVRDTRTKLVRHADTMKRAVALPSYRETVTRAKTALINQQQRLLRRNRDYTAGMKRTLQSFDPQAVLQRGYAVVRHENTVLREAGRVSVGDQIMVQLTKGELEAEVTDVRQND